MSKEKAIYTTHNNCSGFIEVRDIGRAEISINCSDGNDATTVYLGKSEVKKLADALTKLSSKAAGE